MDFFFKRPGIVNVRMVITEEKILSNIDKVKSLINPHSKKLIINRGLGNSGFPLRLFNRPEIVTVTIE